MYMTILLKKKKHEVVLFTIHTCSTNRFDCSAWLCRTPQLLRKELGRNKPAIFLT